MQTASLVEIKKELKHKSTDELNELVLKLIKFKKENKELATYLLFESDDELGFINGVKDEVDEEFLSLKSKSTYFKRKGIRKILRNVKKHIRYSKQKETEVELLIHFCVCLKKSNQNLRFDSVLYGLLERTIITIEKKVSSLHEDLQRDYEIELEELV